MEEMQSKEMDEPQRTFLALGSNVGERIEHLRYAVAQLRSHGSLRVTSTSPVYETTAHMLRPDQQARPYLNAVLEVQSRLRASTLLAFALDIERERGRDRSGGHRWAARTLDIDLLLFGEESIHEPDLTVPHPRMASRRFVLVPLADIAEEVYVPAPFETTVRALLAWCEDAGNVRRTSYTLDDAGAASGKNGSMAR
ncbi:MAG: 2-amino-4-hydroxy-6-hydroxymethyldihydropteridine diphosphokinase [Rhodothermales bacterium]